MFEIGLPKTFGNSKDSEYEWSVFGPQLYSVTYLQTLKFSVPNVWAKSWAI